MKLVIATHNRHKVDEFRALLDIPGMEVDSLPDELPDAPEDNDTFIANAEQKALFYSQFLTDSVLADDSGLQVEALSGEPGVYSARYAGMHGDDAANNRKLIARLQSLGLHKTPGAFVCALAIAQQGHIKLSLEGCVEGTVHDVPAGHHGFGYDALFTPTQETRRFAEMSMAEKSAHSHRAVAVKRLMEHSREWMEQ